MCHIQGGTILGTKRESHENMRHAVRGSCGHCVVYWDQAKQKVMRDEG